MVEEAPSLYPELREAAAPPGKGRHGYYKKPDGWLVVASTTPTNRSDYEYKGFRFLARYGEFVNGTAELRAKQNERDAKGNPWNPAIEPWRLVFQLGGADEFPIDQIIAYRWHVRPPYREVQFPQLQGVEITNYGCPECEKGLFASTNPHEAAQQLRIHLTSAVSDSHRYTPSDLRALGQEWDIDFESSRIARRSVQLKPPEEPEVTEVPDLTLSSKYRCVQCGYEPKGKAPWLALKNHKCLAPVGAAQEGVG